MYVPRPTIAYRYIVLHLVLSFYVYSSSDHAPKLMLKKKKC